MKRRAASLVAFLATGTATVAVDVSTLFAAREVAGMPLALATALGFLLSTVVNFLGHRAWAGREAKSRLVNHAGRYTVLLLINLTLTTMIVTGIAALGPHYLLAKLVAIVVTSAVSFVSYPRWVFV